MKARKPSFWNMTQRAVPIFERTIVNLHLSAAKSVERSEQNWGTAWIRWFSAGDAAELP